jgi:protein-tyrosine phosphatase
VQLAFDAVPPKRGTYWVVEGKLLAGPFPGSSDPAQASAAVAPLLDAGITTFLNLQQATETNYDGKRFTPYETAIGPQAKMVRRPIVDLSIPTREEMTAMLDLIDSSVEDGALYVHCWGGVGRTGTVIGCWLLRHGLATPENVIETIRGLRRADPFRGHRRSPETLEQEQFVLSWQE